MLANTATDASCRIHIRSLKPYLNLNQASRWWERFKRSFFVHFQTPFPVADDSTPAAVRSGRYGAVIIAGGVFSRFKTGILEFYVSCICFCDSQFYTGVDRVKDFPGADGLGADRAIFLADNAGPVHGPRQATTAVDEGGSDLDRPLIGEPFAAQTFIQADGPDGRRRAQMAAGNTVKLATAGADAKIEGRGPQAFESALQTGRMNDIGGTDPHTLAALDAP